MSAINAAGLLCRSGRSLAAVVPSTTHPSVVSAMGNCQSPLNGALAGPVLMVILGRKHVALSNCYFVSTSLAAVYSRPRCGRAGAVQLIESVFV